MDVLAEKGAAVSRDQIVATLMPEDTDALNASATAAVMVNYHDQQMGAMTDLTRYINLGFHQTLSSATGHQAVETRHYTERECDAQNFFVHGIQS